MEEVCDFYEHRLGFQRLGEFRDHEGFDGVMLGHPQAGYHLEFTRSDEHSAGEAPTQESLLVFYVPDQETWQQVVDEIEKTVAPVKSLNPYWDQHGRTYEDPDGYRVVIQNAAWKS